MIAARIFEITFPIFTVVLVGLAYAKRFTPDMTLPNRLNMDVFVPALLFSVLTDQSGYENVFSSLAFGIAFIILISGLIGWQLSRYLNIPVPVLCPPLMFSNAGNLGLPLVVLTFGQQAMPQAVIVFIVCNFFHITIAPAIMHRDFNLASVATNPMMIATMLALGLGFGGVAVPDVILQPIRLLGNICVPLMLFALGVRLAETDLSEWRIGLLVAVLSPVIGVALALSVTPWLQLTPVEQGTLLLFGALPPAVLNYMFAEHYRQQPSRVAAMVLFGNAFSVITLPLALYYVLTAAA